MAAANKVAHDPAYGSKMEDPAWTRPIFTSEKAAIGSNGVFVTQILVLGLMIDV
jgi:hypothetical protein